MYYEIVIETDYHSLDNMYLEIFQYNIARPSIYARLLSIWHKLDDWK